MDPEEIRNLVQELNTTGGFDGALNEEKVIEAAANAPAERTDKILKDLEANRDTVKDPNAWVTSALRKAAGGGSRGGGGGGYGGGGGGAGGGAAQGHEDDKLRRRVGWLNGDGGGFGGSIIYEKVVAAAGGLPYSEVMRVLKDLEEKRDQVKDPNAWVCSALRKAGGGNPQAPTAASLAWGAPPAHAGGGGAWGGPIGAGPGFYAPAYAPAVSWGSSGSPADAEKVRKRVLWLNEKAALASPLVEAKVVEAASGVDVKDAMKILKDLEEKQENVKDPTAYVTAALRKLGGGARGGGGGDWAAPMAVDTWTGPPPRDARHYGPPPSSNWAPDVQTEDAKLRKRIGWLNGQGGFGGAIIYDKILEAAGGLEFSEVFQQLKQLEEKRDSVTDPNAWVCSGLRKASGRQGNVGRGGPPMSWGGGEYGGDAYGGASAMDVDRETTSKLHKRLKWLNDKGGFENVLDFDKVHQASSGVDVTSILKILKDVEEKKDTVKNPLAYVTSALRKAAGGGKGHGKSMPGVRRTIEKARH